jgi:uncharacterized membrane protein YedE/YeeE
MRLRKHLPYLAWGLGFGFIIARAGAVRFDFLRDMFLLKSFRMYGIIASAIATALPLFWWLQTFKKVPHLSWPHRRWTPGTIPGALIFGVGWALTGTCPGPAVVQIGLGHWVALATVAGIFAGNLAYESAHRRWFHWRPDSCA